MASEPRKPAPVHCIVGDTLCRVSVLSEAEWDALPPARRPATAEYFPGLGWVVAVPGHPGLPPVGAGDTANTDDA